MDWWFSAVVTPRVCRWCVSRLRRLPSAPRRGGVYRAVQVPYRIGVMRAFSVRQRRSRLVYEEDRFFRECRPVRNRTRDDWNYCQKR